VIVAFLDDAPGQVVQDRFAALYRTVRFTPGEAPSWRDHLAPREQQPCAGRSLTGREARAASGDLECS
jgi:hypothetical protein